MERGERGYQVHGRGVCGGSVVESELDIAIEERQAGIHFDVLQGSVHWQNVRHDAGAEEGLELQ
jgi:hypothetical protein